MGLMDKFKNLFTDEEIIEEDDVDTVEIKEVKKEEPSKLPTFMREKIEKEEKKSLLKEQKMEFEKNININQTIEKDEIELPKLEEKNTFKFPIDFTENDFIETRSRQAMHQRKQEKEEKEKIEQPKKVKVEAPVVKPEPKVADLYKDKKTEAKLEKPKFRATPIISPIYGILDKNYTSGDIASTTGNNFEEQRHSKSVDFDSVRKKAYGSLSKEIQENLMCENCEYLKEAKECQKIKHQKKKDQRREYFYSQTEEEPQDEYEKYKDITLDEATENYYDYGVAYEKEPEQYQEEVKISNFEQEKSIKEIPPVKSSINLLSTLKKSMGEEPPSKKEDLELTDDLFNLIDSMYDERNEDK